MIKSLKTNKTLGTPSQSIISGSEDRQLISSKKQKPYRFGIGMLFYLVKHPHPDITNSVYHLSKISNKAYQAAFKEMLHVTQLVLDVNNYGVKYAPNLDENGIWYIVCYGNSDYAGNPDSH